MYDNSVNDLQVLGAVGQAARDSAAAQCMDTGNILQGQAGINLANMANTDRLAIAVDDSAHDEGTHNRESVERNSDWINESINRNGSTTLTAVERSATEILSTQERTSSQVISAVERNGTEIKTDQQAIALETRSQLDGHFVDNQVGQKDIVINDNQNTHGLELQSTKNFYATNVDIAHTQNQLELQASVNTAAVQLENLKLNAQAAAEMAACCCELKVDVAKTSHETQQQARDLESKRLRESLAAATTEILINKLKPKCCPPPPPCPCPPPCPP
jgi:hypothetical protein